MNLSSAILSSISYTSSKRHSHALIRTVRRVSMLPLSAARAPLSLPGCSYATTKVVCGS